MQLAGVPVGPKKIAGLAVLVAGLAAFAWVTHLFGAEWGLVLVAAGLGLLLLLAGVTYVEGRRHHHALSQQGDVVQQSADTARQSVAKLTKRVGQIEEAVAESSRQLPTAEERERELRQLDELLEVVHGLNTVVATRLAALENAQHQLRTALAQLRAEQRRILDPDGSALRASVDAEVELIRSSRLFDPGWYSRQARLADEDPVVHYVQAGASLGLDPHPLFASGWYLSRHPDALARWRTPLAHFLVESDGQGLDPHPTFWSRWYADRHLGDEVDDVHDSPVEHFLRQGGADGRDPNPLFHTEWYVSRYGGAIPAGVNPLVYHLTTGSARDHDPSPVFDTADVRGRLGGDPLSRFLELERAGGGALAAAATADDPTDDRTREANRRWEYLVRQLYREPDTFVLYRIVGNDLPPRHREGQSLENLRFVLDHEPDLPGCEKRWVVNRIVDPGIEKEILALLEERGAPYIHIPFVPEEYRNVPWHFTGFDAPGFTYRHEFDDLDATTRQRALDHVYHEKNLYVMNNNGARNAALREGGRLAKWVLPWDGNCFVTRAAWDQVVDAIRERPHLKYFSVPMARVLDNNVLLEPDLQLEATEEPQLIFRGDAEEHFDPDARYGRRPKVYLFYRIGLPGHWDRWKQLPWEPPRPELVPAAGPVGQAGWVARLFSGEPHLEANVRDRGTRRIEAILEKIDEVDESLARRTFSGTALFALDETVLEQQRERYEAKEPGPHEVVSELIARAERSLGGQVYSVTAKTSLPPSGDPHDYWHPAPYWWPNPDTADGLPYVRLDGMRVPGALLWEPGSEQYDRSSLQSMIDETTFTALAGFFTGEGRFYDRGADLVRAWFLRTETRMNPHLRYAQVRRGHNGDEGYSSGVLEAKDFYYLLDAVRLVERSGALSDTDVAGLREWFREYRAWLADSPQGCGERAALNNHGTWYDVQVAAIDAYLDDTRALLGTFRRSYERVAQQIHSDGRQLEELKRNTTQHYCSYNLQGWVVLAACARRVGHDLWRYQPPQGGGLMAATRWVLDHLGLPWPYEQINEFDTDRWLVLAHQASGTARPPSWEGRVDSPGKLDPWRVKQVFTPHDGIRPFWCVGQGEPL